MPHQITMVVNAFFCFLCLLWIPIQYKSCNFNKFLTLIGEPSWAFKILLVCATMKKAEKLQCNIFCPWAIQKDNLSVAHCEYWTKSRRIPIMDLQCEHNNKIKKRSIHKLQMEFNASKWSRSDNLRSRERSWYYNEITTHKQILIYMHVEFWLQ